MVRDLVEQGVADVVRVQTELNTADVFTKPLCRDLFERHRVPLLTP